MIRLKPDTIAELQDELFRRTGEGWFTIISGSMRPLLEIGDRVLVMHVAPPAVRVRDIVLFKSEGVFVSHRILKFERTNSSTMVLEKGDAGAYASLVPANSILGKVVAIEKKGRLLDLTSGRGKLVNSYLGMRTCALYRIASRTGHMKQRVRNIPGFVYVRAAYRIIKKPLSVFRRMLVKMSS